MISIIKYDVLIYFPAARQALEFREPAMFVTHETNSDAYFDVLYLHITQCSIPSTIKLDYTCRFREDSVLLFYIP